MMWLWTLVCICVGLAYAAQQNPGWQNNQEYIYQVRSRSLTSLHDNTNNYTGIFLRAKLSIKSTTEGKIYGKLLEPQYAPLHGSLEDGWKTEVPDSQLSYKNLNETMSNPFQVVITDKGLIRKLILSKNMSNWEANIIKSIVSQFQLDTNANNYIASSINALPEDRFNGVFKTMEETVTGISETQYDIHPLSEYLLQTEPWLAPLPELNQDGHWIEIVKSKNFTNSKNRPSYHFGFHGIEDYELDNKIGDFFTRISGSSVVLSGDLDKYTVQSSVTIDQILMSPLFNQKQRGSVTTVVNVTLQSVQPQTQSLEEVPDPVQVSLIYAYNQPFSANNQPRPQSEVDLRTKLEILLYSNDASISDCSSSEEDRMVWQEKPTLEEAPALPLLPFTIGYNGQSIKKQQNIVDNVRRLTKIIGQESCDSQKMIKEGTVSKFVVLSSLVRLMNLSEIHEVARWLYKKENHQVTVATWEVFRDAVAQAGTGPALLTIKKWIENGVIAEEQAAEIVCRAADATRQPTLEYMKTFFRMVQSENIQRQSHLNESALLCYTTLTYDVYVNKNNAHNKYPVHSFGSFHTKEGVKFVEEQVIPELTMKLHESVTKADVHQIHTYIRALGNLGHRQILAAFKPYLEGRKQVSQFQRLLMVVALDNLASSNPKVARAVLYRIYQNSNEDEQVRVAAVAQLMRTVPPASMLQRMAAHTNEDSHQYVNAAVKSAIESASQLEGSEHAKLRSAAYAAKHLLTTREYGIQFSQDKLRSHVIEEMQMAYEQTIQSFGSLNHIWPREIHYTLREKHGGFRQQVVNLKAMVSSIDDLVNVLQQQTKKYQKDKAQKQTHDGSLHKLSSEYIAKLWNMENEQREQLEGMLYFQIGALQKIWSLNNHSIENISEIISELESELRNGKSVNFKKMWIQNEVALSFPTSMGLPFIYTYDKPMFVNFETKIKAQSTPSVSAGKTVQKPNSVNAEFELFGSVSGKTQSQFGIFTPFDGQRYSAGYEKNFQIAVPLAGHVEADLLTNQLKIELRPDNWKNVHFHYSSVPFTANNDIYEPTPKRNVIRKKRQHVLDTGIGDESTGIAVDIKMTSDQALDVASVYDKLRRHDLISAMLNPWLDADIHHEEINIKINADRSSTEKIVFLMGCQHKIVSGRQDQSDDILLGKIDRISDESTSRQNRQIRFMELSMGGIKDSRSHVVDVHVQFSGPRTIKYTATLAMSKSNVHPKSRLIVHLKKQDQEGKINNFYLGAEAHFPNTNGLNMDYAIEMDTTSNIDIKAGFGDSFERSKKLTANIMLSKTEERKQYLKEHPQYKECKHQMEEGNYQLPICAKMTAEANLLNQFEMKVNYENMDQSMTNYIYLWYSILRRQMYPHIEEDLTQSHQSIKNQLYIKGRFRPDLRVMNFSITSEYGSAEVRNVEINQWWQQLLVPHPVFHAESRILSHVYKYFTYRPICVIDQTAVSTFDNKTYPATLGDDWTVLLHYVPRRPSFNQNQPQQSVREQLWQEPESHIIWVREQQSRKEIKIIIQTPETGGKIVEVGLKPGQSSKMPRLFINDQEVDYREKSNIYDEYLQVYLLPNNEMKVEVQKSYYLIYDGTRAKLTVNDAKFRDASRGLCGTFTGEEKTDFTSPDNCILHSPEEFVQSYTMSQEQYQRSTSKCWQKKINYVKVISSEEIGRSDNHLRKNYERSCLRHQTRYVLMGDEICFSLRPLPECRSSCYSVEKVSKQIAVHCVQASTATLMVKSQIDQGASPDFSMKSESRKVMMDLPIACLL